MNEKKPIKNKIKIKVQSQISPLILFLVIILIIAIIAGLVYLLFISNSRRGGDNIGELIALLVFAIPFLVKNALNKDDYVSDIEITNKDLTLIYKEKKKTVGKQVIPLKDIKKFHVKLDSNIQKVGSKSSIITSFIFVTIETSNGTITFSKDSNCELSFLTYKLMLDLLKVSYFIPNFSYEVKGNATDVKDDVEYFAIHGKRIPFVKKSKKQWARMKKGQKFATVLILLLVLGPLISLGYLFYLQVPSVLNNTEKNFMIYFDNGYNARQNEDYKTALEMFEKAEALYDKDPEIFYQKAYCLEELGEYEKAIAAAKEGLRHLEDKSIYKKAKNYHFDLRFDLYLYSVIGDSNYKLRRYTEAKDAYSYIIENGRNAWHYFKRGKCEYYLGDYKDAMSDFLTYKANIEESMNSEYPMYDQEDLQQVNTWIDNTTEMMKFVEKNI